MRDCHASLNHQACIELSAVACRLQWPHHHADPAYKVTVYKTRSSNASEAHLPSRTDQSATLPSQLFKAQLYRMAPHAPKDRWDVVYARSFENQPEGHALYQNLSTKELRPGSCGYFDDRGHWQLVANLTNKQLEDYDKVPGLQVRSKSGAQWPLRVSQGVSGTKLEVGAGASFVDCNQVLGLPRH